MEWNVNKMAFHQNLRGEMGVEGSIIHLDYGNYTVSVTGSLRFLLNMFNSMCKIVEYKMNQVACAPLFQAGAP